MKVEINDLIPTLENKHDHDKHRTTNATLDKVFFRTTWPREKQGN